MMRRKACAWWIVAGSLNGVAGLKPTAFLSFVLSHYLCVEAVNLDVYWQDKKRSRKSELKNKPMEEKCSKQMETDETQLSRKSYNEWWETENFIVRQYDYYSDGCQRRSRRQYGIFIFAGLFGTTTPSGLYEQSGETMRVGSDLSHSAFLDWGRTIWWPRERERKRSTIFASNKQHAEVHKVKK